VTGISHIYIGLPAYNEETALPRLLARIREWSATSGHTPTVVLYNDGSTDATLSIGRERQQRNELVLLTCDENKGLGAGVRALIDFTVDAAKDDEVLVIMDCDDTHDPSQISEMLPRLSNGADVVIASRFAAGATIRGVPLIRRCTAFAAAALFKLIHPVRQVWDYTCGFRAYKIKALRLARSRYPNLVSETGFSCMVELLLKLNSIGIRFAEIPLHLRYDLKPTASKMPVVGNSTRLLKLMTKWRLRGFNNS
jgi:dolichol-phosphate mannosyltransferase